MTKMRRFSLGLLAATVLGSSAGAASELVAERVQKLTRAVRWRPVATIPINFKTHHPQGMVKIGDTFFVSSVEITVPTKRFPEPKDGYDRDTGQGAGHLFKIDAKGNLLGSVLVGR